jgi:5-methylcytosine-specific restriction enzyme A
MRNPKWHRDEIILALDLYFSLDRGSIDHKNPKIIELSKTLNALPLFPDRPDEDRFRNSNGVTLKLSNFLAFDPNYKGKGMTGVLRV